MSSGNGAREARTLAAPLLPGAQPSASVAWLDQPALVLVDGPPAPAAMWDAGAAQVLVRFRDGTWRLCRVTGRAKRGDGTWLMELRWGIPGRICQARYAYDPAMVSPVG